MLEGGHGIEERKQELHGYDAHFVRYLQVESAWWCSEGTNQGIHQPRTLKVCDPWVVFENPDVCKHGDRTMGALTAILHVSGLAGTRESECQGTC